MTIQEEIYTGLMEHLGDTVAVNSCEADLQIVAGVILNYLHSKGVVIKINKLDADTAVILPLIEDSNG